MTNLLVNHDFRPQANYTPAAITQFSIKVDGVPTYKPNPAHPPDQGNAATIEAISEFKGDGYFWPTQRQETTREFFDPITGQKKSSVSVHLHEL